MDYIKAQAEFETARNNYFEAREKEAEKIEDYLRKKSFFPEIKHAVENWIEIEASDSDSFYYLISLQPFDINKKFSSKYHHTVYDRIGVYAANHCDAKKVCRMKVFEEMFFTYIDLPVSVDDLDVLTVLIEKLRNGDDEKDIREQIKIRKNQPEFSCNKDMKFAAAKNEYKKQRNIQRQQIIDLLKCWGYINKDGESALNNKGGYGLAKHGYKRKGKVKEDDKTLAGYEYDLTNWKYIDAMKDGEFYFISLNPYDGDFNRCHNNLLDRIGVCKYVNGIDPDSLNMCNYMTLLEDIELPINDEKAEKLRCELCKLKTVKVLY